MTKRLAILALLMLAFGAGTCLYLDSPTEVSPRGGDDLVGMAEAQEEERSAVRATFAAFRAAAGAGDGARAVELLDHATFDYYDRMADLARSAPAARVRSLGLLDRLVVLSIRHRLTPEEVAALDGRRLVEVGIRDGWLGGGATARTELGSVTVAGDVATSTAFLDGGADPHVLVFQREGEAWRFRLTSTNAAAAEALDAAARQSGLPPDAFLESLLERATGRPVLPAAWEAPVPRP